MNAFSISELISTFLVYFGIIVLTIIIWYIYWLKASQKLLLPDNNSNNPLEIITFFYKMILKIPNNTYHLNHIGFESYSYLLYMRKLFILTGIMFIISMITGIPYALGYSKADLWNSYALEDDYFHWFFQMFYMVLFAIIILCGLFRLKLMLRQLYIESKLTNPEVHYDRFKTVKINGIDLNDENCSVLKQKIQESVPDSLVAVIPIPKCSKWINLQAELTDLTLKKSLQNSENTCCLPQKYTFESYYNNQINIVSEKIKKQGQKPLKFSGQAFLLINSQENLNRIISCFSVFRIGFWAGFCNRCKDSNDEDDSMCESLIERKNTLIATAFPDPTDIFWRNFGKLTNFSFFLRGLLNLFAILLMLFLSTPAAIASVLGINEIVKVLKSDKDPQPGSFSSIIEKNLFPLIILLINQLLLLVIDKLAYWKEYTKISSIQISIYYNCVAYLMLNTLILPGFSVTATQSILSFLSDSEEANIDRLVTTFYISDTGQLFVIILLQAATFSFIGDILRLSELFGSFFNRKLANLRRLGVLINRKWIKDEDSIFQYGYNYGRNITFITIVFVFCTIVPTICLFGCFYFCLKLFCDWYNLMTIYRKEMNSHGIFINKVINATGIALIFSQIVIFAYYLANKWFVNAALTIIVAFLTALFLIFKLNFNVCEEDEHDDYESEMKIKEWEKLYSFQKDDINNNRIN